MRKGIKLFVVYFPVVLVALQVLGNALYFILPSIYYGTAFYLNLFLGTNFLFAFFLLAFTFMFRFCAVSRWAAGAECIFAILYLIIQSDTVYNILIQITVGLIALIATFWHYIKKFPHCNFSVGLSFLANSVKHSSCRKSIDHFDSKVKRSILKNHHAEGNG